MLILIGWSAILEPPMRQNGSLKINEKKKKKRKPGAKRTKVCGNKNSQGGGGGGLRARKRGRLIISSKPEP